MVNTPIPASLKSEAKKAAKILREFTIPNAKVGPDKIIPAGLVSNAQGLAILTVAKVGFLVTARGGSGIVIAKLDDGSWSAPSAIGIAGLGGGLEIGAEVTDFIIILNKRAAVQAFSKGGNLTLGGNFTIAAGPLGRNVEGDVSLRSTAAIYTYSRTKGLFAGISIEGSGLIERKDANKKFYGQSIRAFEILDGHVERPPECTELYEVLERHDTMFKKAALAYAKRRAVSEARKTAAGGTAGIMAKVRSIRSGSLRSGGSPEKERSSPEKERRKTSEDSGHSSGQSKWYDSSRQGAAADSDSDDGNYVMSRSQSTYSASRSPGYDSGSASPSSRHSGSRPPPKSRSYSGSESQKLAAVCKKPPRPIRPPAPKVLRKTYVQQTESAWDRPPMARALWAFQGQMPCDLTFKEGAEIEILTRTGHQNDWWEGKLNGRLGIFPANYVEVVSLC